MIVTETVLDVELRKCNPALTQPCRSVEDRDALAAAEPGLTLLAARPSRRGAAAAKPLSFVHRVAVVRALDVAEELIWVWHCTEPPPTGEPTALAAGATATVPATAAAIPTAAAARDRLMV